MTVLSEARWAQAVKRKLEFSISVALYVYDIMYVV